MLADPPAQLLVRPRLVGMLLADMGAQLAGERPVVVRDDELAAPAADSTH
jgi:hypothetical protein